MESHTKPKIRPKVSKEIIPKFALKSRIMARKDPSMEAMKLEHVVNEQTSILLYCNIFPTRNKMYHSGESIDKYNNDGLNPL